MQKLFLLLTIICLQINFIFSISEEKKEELTNYINAYMQQHQIVGLSLGLGEEGEISWLKGFGYANLENQVKVDPYTTTFRWASMSKQVASILSFKMNEQGLLDFDENIEHYWKDYKTPDLFSINCNGQQRIEYEGQEYDCENGFALAKVSEGTFISQGLLLSMYAGIESYDDGTTNPVPPDAEKNNPAINDGIEWATKYYKDSPFAYQPNSKYSYTTFGINLAGVVATYAGGEFQGRYEDLTRAAIFAKVHSQLPSIVPDFYWTEKYRPYRATGYLNPDQLSVDNDVSYKVPGGGFSSTVVDAVTFAINFRNNTLLNEEQKQKAWQPYHKDLNPSYGMGFSVRWRDNVLLAVGHDGAQDGARSCMRYYPEVDVALTFMSNSENLNTSELQQGIEKILFGDDGPVKKQQQEKSLIDKFLSKFKY